MGIIFLCPRPFVKSQQTHPSLCKDVKKVSLTRTRFIVASAKILSTTERTLNPRNHFLVPRQRVKDFIGRESLLDQIRSHFSNDQSGTPTILILYALGGQGKSQIALEYCRKWRDTYRGVFWIDANSETTVTQSYGTIAAELFGASQIESYDSAVQIKMVQGDLERWSEAWLMVFDNYDEPEKFREIKQFIPISRPRSVVGA